MDGFYDELNKLVNDINNGNLNQDEVNHIITHLKKKYGNDVFPSYEFQKKSKPWTKEYFYSLIEKNITGACSEEYILHMAEVSDYIKEKKHISLLIITISIVAIVVFVIILSTIKMNNTTQIANAHIQKISKDTIEEDNLISLSEANSNSFLVKEA